MRASETFDGLRRRDAFQALIQEVEAVIGPAVRAYIADLGEEFEPSGAKSIKDAVWGMVDLTPNEVVVIDSPPMQRLRRIRQLGVTYLTYPTAGYSRFEHSIGALHQAQRMLTAIGNRSPFSQDVDEVSPIVRLAALVHDTGHMPYSHISERYFSEQECTREELLELAESITADPAEELQTSEPSLAECLSAAILATPSFDDLLRKAGYSRDEIASAALAILGKSPTVRELFVSQLISNVVDADKLDYMFRDAFVTRVPLAVDLERLLFKLTIVDVAADQLWGSLARSAKATDRALVLGADATGQEITYDLASARKILFGRIYFHHKTRAAERVVLRALDELGLRPAQLLGYEDDLFGRFGSERFPAIRPLTERLLYRRLPRRIFALADDFIDRDVIARQAPSSGVLESTKLRHAITDAARRVALEQQIVAEAQLLAEVVGGEVPSEAWIDPPADPIGTGDARLPEITPDGTVMLPDAYPPGAAAAAQNPLPATYVFVTETTADTALAHIAAQRVFAREFALYFTERAAVQAKVSPERVVQLKRRLETADPEAFRGLRGLRPPSQAAHSAHLKSRIDQQAYRFQHFTNDSGVHVDAARVRSYLDQFPEQLIEPMLRAIERIHWLDRTTLGQEFAARLLADAPPDAVFAPLTAEYGKSAALVPYFLADHPNRPEILDLQAALATQRPIVVFDDVLISGVQSRRVADTWFGEDNLSSAPPLSEAEQQMLRDLAVAFRFGYAWRSGLEGLAEALHLRELDASVDALRIDETEHPLDEVGAEAEALRDFLRQVGYETLKSTKGSRDDDPWPDQRCQDCAVGYNNDERLIVLEYNTPTGTITPLWHSGVFDGAQWMPLFPRRQTST